MRDEPAASRFEHPSPAPLRWPRLIVDSTTGILSVSFAVIGEPLDRVRHAGGAEAPLHALEHQVPDHLPADAAGAGAPGHDLSVAGIQRKGHTDHLTIPACDLKPIRGPAQVRSDRDDLSVVRARGAKRFCHFWKANLSIEL